jgi:hypothetical protein
MSNNRTKVAIYFPCSVLAVLRADAVEDDRNLSAHVTRLCRRAMKNEERPSQSAPVNSSRVNTRDHAPSE